MNGRLVRGLTLLLAVGLVPLSGCRNHQHAQVLDYDDRDMVGSHEAGAETWKPLVEESVAKLLMRSTSSIEPVSYTSAEGLPVRTVCFVGVENCSSEPLGDFREQIYEHIDSRVSQAPNYQMISRRVVEAAMNEIRCRPDALILQENQRRLQAALERADQPFDFLLFARITSGTTQVNGDYQRDYKLTLELLDTRTLTSIKESADLRKGYHQSYLSKLKHRVTSGGS